MDASSHRHPLKRRELLLAGGERRVCGLCGEEVMNGWSAYECSQCYFTAHLDCAENPPPLVIDKRKIHEHTLTLLPRHVTFICNACGLSGDKSPYVCLKCSFMIHGDCIEFPRVIKISRHDHRLAHNFFFGPREWICGVCHERVDGRYGAYTCMKCDYAVHLKCATREDVWDGKDLEGVPEENEDIMPFEEIGDGLIVHFSHEHVLRLQSNKDMIRDVVCSGCSFPIASDPFYYRCQQCDFFLHDKCANLPRRIQMFLHKHPLTLCTEDERSGGPNGLSRCRACNLLHSGFRYYCLECKDDHIEFDVRCSSVSEPLIYTFHPHPLVSYPGTRLCSCSLCNQLMLRYSLGCLYCGFKLCFTCATSPSEVNYKYDEHLLHHTIGEHFTTNPYWCDICENKIEEMSIHYKCSDCGPVLHTECALGSFRNMRPGFSFVTKHGHEYKVILNDRTSLLRCSQCHNDCHEPLLLMSTNTTTNDTIYLCSSTCFDTYVSV